MGPEAIAHHWFEEERHEETPGMRVCVIGGGVAGLVSAKVLKHDGFDVTEVARVREWSHDGRP